MFGLETEYAITCIAGSSSYDREELVGRVLQIAKERFLHLPDLHSAGLYFGNGSRLYGDCGNHPEFSTCEVVNPTDAVRYVKAGERILEEVTRQLSHEVGSEVMCFICNVDYRGATYGCHESYLHQADPALLPVQLIPHLVTRIVYTGAGGFNPVSPGLQFSLSPRSAYINKVTSDSSTNERGIYHSKNETLSAAGYNRCHLICGESLCGELGTFLKVGVTALVVAMIEAGLFPGSAVALKSPVEALHAVAADAHCRVMLDLADGRKMNALQIQRHYLAQAERHAGNGLFPPWSHGVIKRWADILNLLEKGPEATDTILDWSIKRALYTARANRRGTSLETLPSWNYVLDKLKAAIDRTEFRRQWSDAAFVLGPNSPILEEVASLTPYLRAHGLRWLGLTHLQELKSELLEIDTKFGQLGEKGIFRTMDRAGVLRHHVEGVDHIEKAVSTPPAAGRAKLRGEAIRRYSSLARKYSCDWQGIWDVSRQRILDLSDPFASNRLWRDLSPADRARGLLDFLMR